MDIVYTSFQSELTIEIKGDVVKVIAYKTPEHGNIKFGIQAPRHINIHRKEIYEAIQQQALEVNSSTE